MGSASATGTAAVFSVAVCFRCASPFLTGRPTRLPVKIATVGVVTAQTRPPCAEGWRTAAEGASTRRPRQRVGVTVQLASSATSKRLFRPSASGGCTACSLLEGTSTRRPRHSLAVTGKSGGPAATRRRQEQFEVPVHISGKQGRSRASTRHGASFWAFQNCQHSLHWWRLPEFPLEHRRRRGLHVYLSPALRGNRGLTVGGEALAACSAFFLFMPCMPSKAILRHRRCYRSASFTTLHGARVTVHSRQLLNLSHSWR